MAVAEDKMRGGRTDRHDGRSGLARLGWVRLEFRPMPATWRHRPWVILGPCATVLSRDGQWLAETAAAPGDPALDDSTPGNSHLDKIRWSDQQTARNFFRDWMRRNADRYRA